MSVWAAYVLYNYGTKVGAVLGNAENYAAADGAAGGTLGTGTGARGRTSVRSLCSASHI